MNVRHFGLDALDATRFGSFCFLVSWQVRARLASRYARLTAKLLALSVFSWNWDG
jgi:hypothetical protein